MSLSKNGAAGPRCFLPADIGELLGCARKMRSPVKKCRRLRHDRAIWVENALDALTEPGEWCVDTRAGKIFFWPVHPADLDCVTAPALMTLLKIEGENDALGGADKPVRGLRFQGITFTQADRAVMGEDDIGVQHDWDFRDKDDALVRLRGAEGCNFTACTFADSGGGGLRMDLHAQKNIVDDCECRHLGGAGITMYGYGPGRKDVNKGNRVTNCHIHHIAEIWTHCYGIFIWQSGDNYVGNNLIHHTSWEAVGISGVRVHFFRERNKDLRECARSIRWEEVGDVTEWEDIVPFLHARNNIVEFNEAHTCLLKLGDGGVMNISGAGKGNVLRRNYVHDVLSEEWTDSALRTDDWQNGSLIAENIVINCNDGGICMKGDNDVINNCLIHTALVSNAAIRITERNGSAKIMKNVIVKSALPARTRPEDIFREDWDDQLLSPIVEREKSPSTHLIPIPE